MRPDNQYNRQPKSLQTQVLKNSFRSQDLCCRHGDEEFAIAFPACTASQARGALDAFRSRLSAAIAAAGLPTFTASAGVVDAKAQENLPAVLARADIALYQAKHGGRDQVVVHDATGETILSPEGDDADAAEVSRTLAAVSGIRRQQR